MKKVTIGLNVDPYATLDSTPEEEYEEMEKAIGEALPGVALRFIRDLLPHKLKNESCSVYVFDIGGLCREDWNGERRLRFCKDINQLADERPSTLFVPWSKMTRDYLRTALRMLVDDWDNSDLAAEDIKFTQRPNVALPHERDEEKLFGYGSTEHYTAAIRRWVELG